MMSGDIWHILGIDPTEDLRSIKRAYARKVRENNPEDAPEQFQAIRIAYEIALSYADRKTADVNLSINNHQPTAPVNTPSEPFREGEAAFHHDNAPLPSEATQAEDMEPPGMPVNRSLVDQLVQDVIEAVRSVDSWDEKRRFKAALEALRAESVDTALQFELALSRELIRCDGVPDDFLASLIQHYGWHVSYVRNRGDNELQYHVNTLIGRSREYTAEEEVVVVKPGRKSSSGGFWIIWAMVVMALHLVRACPGMESTPSHSYPERKDPMALVKKVEIYRARARQERLPNENPAIDINDPNCARLWPGKDGATASIISCAEWEKRRRAQLGQTNDFAASPDDRTPSLPDSESLRVKPYTFEQVQKQLQGRRTMEK